MTRRMKLILTRPTDESLESFENFRRITTLKLAKTKTGLIKDDLAVEWEKFWERINSKPKKLFAISNSSEYLN